MGRESEQVSIMALAEYLRVGVRITYLDGRSCPPAVIKLPAFPVSVDAGCSGGDGAGATSMNIEVSLLYRPGHYDILYEKREDRREK